MADALVRTRVRMIVTVMVSAILVVGRGSAEQYSEQGSGEFTPVNVGMIALLAAPEKYDGIRVRTFGFLCLAFEGNALYLHKEDYMRGLGKNALELNLTQAQERQFRSLNLKYVIMEGTILGSRAVVERSVAGGAIGKITRIEYWHPRPEGKDKR